MMPKTPKAILTVLLVALLSSCSSTRSLPDGRYRLAGNEVEVLGDKKLSPKEFEKYVQQKSNSYLIFGWNPFLNLYNLSGQDTTRLGSRLVRKIGVAPVVYEPSAVDASVTNIGRHLEYLGYYNSKVGSSVNYDGRKVKVLYTVEPGKRYKIGKLEYSVPEGEFSEDFYADTLNVTIKPGDYLAEALLEEETERSAEWMRRHGWFGFNKNYYSFEADTLQKKDTADLVMYVREYTRNQTPETAKPFRKYTFGDVSISWDKNLKFNDRVIRNMNTVSPGKLYDEREVNNTYSRLSALKLFSGVNISLNPRDTADVVDCDINLTNSRLQGFKLNFEASTNSNGLIGNSPQISYFHKNIFHGGQWLNLSFLGNFQYMWKNSSIRSNEFGASVGLSFPEFLGLPNSIFHGPNVPRTDINASFNYLDRPEFTRIMISSSFGYSGSFSRGRFIYQLYPLQAKIVRLQDVTDAFYDLIGDNPILYNTYSDHFDVGSGAIIYYTTCTDLIPRRSYRYVRFSLDASGNVLNLLGKTFDFRNFGVTEIWGIPCSQYIRSELTLGETFVFGRNDTQALAIRLLGGYGMALGGAFTLPFEKQFYSGGANSMRGWQARTLGPGRQPPIAGVVIPSQTGDIKLEANIEYRFPMFWKLQGALFMDAGNVWYGKFDDFSLIHPNREGFGKDIALDWGGGVRADLTFLILRIDLGVKLYDPSEDSIGWYSPSDWRRKDCFALHFGVGYPF
ncbi:MAG: BamA/TamA family outer membrane protein [Bacteroidales bacterium]|nr:BamA/TamA family outer membrane protein [Bacteroidales bacterium]